TRRNFGSTKWCIVCTTKLDLTTCTSWQRNRGKPPRNLVLGLKKWIGHVRCEKTKRNFGSTKWCILCTAKPDLTTGTSWQRNCAKPPRNLVLGLMKWIGQVRCEKTRRNFGSTKWCILCTPKPDLTTCTSRQRNRTKPPKNIVLGLKKWIGHVCCEKTRRNFGSSKRCIVCTPKPDLTTGTSRQRNPVKPPRNLVLGLKKWIGHVRCEKTRRNFESTKWCIVCTPKPDLTTGTSRQRNRAKQPRNLVLGLKKWIGHVCCEKTRRNFGSSKRCIVCTPKPDLTTCTSRQRNRVKPTRNLVLGLKKWIGHVRCEKTRRNFESTKWCIVCTPKPDLTTGTSRKRNRAKPPRTLVLGLKKWIGHVRCEKTRRNFGSTKWCIVCSPKPDLTTCTS